MRHCQDLDESSNLKDTFKEVSVRFIEYHHVEDELLHLTFLYNSLQS